MTHLLNFKKQFAPLVEDGTKRQTMRPHRERMIAEGHTLHLYTLLRQKGARLLRTETCASVEPIEVTKDGCLIGGMTRFARGPVCQQIAKADGFDSWQDLWAFFEATYRGSDVLRKGVAYLDVIKW